MEKKKTLKIDLDELYDAMENSSYEVEYYLDLELVKYSLSRKIWMMWKP